MEYVRGQGQAGDENCRCLSQEEIIGIGSIPLTNIDNSLTENIDVTTYGVGCAPHDEDTFQCSNANDCSSVVPLPPDCDMSYCKRSWCFVDKDCALTNKPSTVYSGRHYSYATCGELDRFTYTERLKSLDGKHFKVGFTSNSGGWKGSYNPMGSFSVNELWNGPTIEFIKEAALVGGFTINMTSPPEWLRPHRARPPAGG